MDLEHLVRLARKAPNPDYKHAAALYTPSGKLIVAASNRWQEHAEYRVVKRYFAVPKFRDQKLGYMVVIRVTRGASSLTNSKPCRKCSKLLDTLNLKVLYSEAK